METRANYIAVGMFTLAIIACAFLFILWLARSGDGTTRREITVSFPGAVTGLLKGGQVLFNGINIGEVRRLSLDTKDPNRVVVVIAVDERAPIKVDTQAALGYQGLTGVAYVHLRGGTRGAKSLWELEKAEIQAKRSGLEDLMDGARKFMVRAENTLKSLQKAVDENAPSVRRAVQNIEKFSQSLGDNADGISTFLSDISGAAKSFTSLAKRLEGLADNIETILVAVDPNAVEQIVGNVRTLSGELADASKNVGPLMADMRQAASQMLAFADNLNGVLVKVDAVVGAVDPSKVAVVVESVAALASALAERGDDLKSLIVSARSAAANINEISGNIAEKSPDIQTIIADVKSATGKLQDVADKANKLFAAVDPDAVSKTVGNVQGLTDRLAAKGEDIDAIIAAARKSMENIRNVTGDLEMRREDIQQVITDTKELASRLNAAAARVGGIVNKVEEMVSGDSSGFFNEATEAAAAIKRVARAFEGRADVIAGGLARFSDRGLKEAEAMVKNWRRVAREIERTVSQFQRDPQRFLFGESGTRGYTPRRR